MKKRENSLPPLSESQMEIMNVVWEKKEATLGEIWTTLAENRSVAKNTVQTLLTRLVDKGWLQTRTEGKTFHYRSAAPKAATLKEAVKRLVDTAFKGSSESLVMALLEHEHITADEIARIKQIIETAEARDKGHKGE